MKKLLVLVSLVVAASCSNPEDKATGNTDSTSMNHSGKETNLNTPNDEPGNKNDTSASPTTSSENANSKKDGTNRSYKAGGDSSEKK